MDNRSTGPRSEGHVIFEAGKLERFSRESDGVDEVGFQLIRTVNGKEYGSGVVWYPTVALESLEPSKVYQQLLTPLAMLLNYQLRRDGNSLATE